MRMRLRAQRYRPAILIVSLLLIIIGTAILALNTSVTILWMRWTIGITAVLLNAIGITIWISNSGIIKGSRAATAPLWVHRVLAFIACLLIIASSVVIIIVMFNNLDSNKSLTILSIVLSGSAVVVALCQWLFPRPPVLFFNKPDTVQPSLPQPTPEPLAIIDERSRIREPLTDTTSMQPCEEVVRDLYKKLIHPDTTAVALIGIAGVGKSTLAALIYHHAKKQRLAKRGPFTAPELWLEIDPSDTIPDLGKELFGAQSEEPMLEHSTLSSRSPVEKLLDVLNSREARLVILDQFDNLLDKRTGLARADVLGLKEWLDAINSRSCKCRILLTSCLLPRGSGKYLPSRIKEQYVDGLKIAEGIELLKKQEVKASEQDWRTAVERCGGHGFALVLLASLLKHHSLSLADFLKDPKYNDFWKGDIAREFHKHIEHLDQAQRELLLAFSIYRKPRPLEAAQALMDANTKIPEIQIQSALGVLLRHHLLQAKGEGRYQVHVIAAIVIDYLQRHPDERHEQISQQALRVQHSRAAQHYLRQKCPAPWQRRQSSDILPLIEAVWHQCQAEQWSEAYTLMQKEDIFSSLQKWGDTTTLRELCELLLLSGKWQPTSPEAKYIHSYQDGIYRELENA